MVSARRLQRASLPQLVTNELREDIQRGAILPGHTLPPEAELASQFGISRAVVREALKSLQAQGLVKVINGVGSVVQPLNSTPLAQYFSFAASLHETSVVELLEVRRGIEGEAARLAATRARPGDLAALQRLVEQMGDSMANPAAFVEFDTVFHVAVARASRNQVLVHLTEALRVPLHRSIETGLASWMRSGELAKVHRIHVDVLEAIRSGEPQRATPAMNDHFEQALRILDEVRLEEPLEVAAGGQGGHVT